MSDTFFIAVNPTVHVYAKQPNVTETNNVTLRCVNDPNTYPTYLVWKFNQQVIVGQSQDHLSLLKVQRQQSWLYTCEVTNSAGTGEYSLYLIAKCEF